MNRKQKDFIGYTILTTLLFVLGITFFCISQFIWGGFIIFLSIGFAYISYDSYKKLKHFQHLKETITPEELQKMLDLSNVLIEKIADYRKIVDNTNPNLPINFDEYANRLSKIDKEIEEVTDNPSIEKYKNIINHVETLTSDFIEDREKVTNQTIKS